MEYELEINEIPRIKEITIENYKNIKKASLKFTHGLNLIVGDNNSGKTNVINYLLERYDSATMAKDHMIVFQTQKKLNSSTLLIDGLFEMLDDEKLLTILEDLSNAGRQIVATMNTLRFNMVKDKVKANIIYTNDFE